MQQTLLNAAIPVEKKDKIREQIDSTQAARRRGERGAAIADADDHVGRTQGLCDYGARQVPGRLGEAVRESRDAFAHACKFAVSAATLAEAVGHADALLVALEVGDEVEWRRLLEHS